MRYTNESLIDFRESYRFDSNVRLNLGIEDAILNRGDIVGREYATSFSLNGETLDVIIEKQGTSSVEVMSGLIDQLDRIGILPKFNGIGIELGSGLGILSASILKREEVSSQIKCIVALEAVRSFVDEGITLAGKTILGMDYFRLLPALGTFDDISIEDGSIDFALQVESFHHATSLDSVIPEVSRILKKGGILLSIDRSWPDSVSDEFINELLDHEYPKEWLAKKGYPPSIIKCRRDNGEHEYRDREWKTALASAGFQELIYQPIHPPLKLWNVVKRIATIAHLDRVLGIKAPARRGLLRGALASRLGINPVGVGGVLITNHPRPLIVKVFQRL